MGETYVFETMTAAQAERLDTARDLVVISLPAVPAAAAIADQLVGLEGNDCITGGEEPVRKHRRGRFKRNARRQRRKGRR